MCFTTPISIPHSPFEIAATDQLLLLGSCFADEVGSKFINAGFDALVNPFGTLYNPASIAALLRASQTDTAPTPIFCDNEGIYHSWLHHSRFSASTQSELEQRIATAYRQVEQRLRTADVMIVTLGTAIVYRMANSGMLVANCHKQPDSLFVRQRLSAESIVSEWRELLEQLRSVNPNLRIIFTVSPIRHKRDGMHINQISKGILLQAVDDIISPPLPHSAGETTAQTDGRSSAYNNTAYFPSYEIMLDELRDYRFYADDMIHPSPLAVDYIWQRFQDTYFSSQTRDIAAKKTKENKRLQHRAIVK